MVSWLYWQNTVIFYYFTQIRCIPIQILIIQRFSDIELGLPVVGLACRLSYGRFSYLPQRSCMGVPFQISLRVRAHLMKHRRSLATDGNRKSIFFLFGAFWRHHVCNVKPQLQTSNNSFFRPLWGAKTRQKGNIRLPVAVHGSRTSVLKLPRLTSAPSHFSLPSPPGDLCLLARCWSQMVICSPILLILTCTLNRVGGGGGGG